VLRRGGDGSGRLVTVTPTSNLANVASGARPAARMQTSTARSEA